MTAKMYAHHAAQCGIIAVDIRPLVHLQSDQELEFVQQRNLAVYHLRTAKSILQGLADQKAQMEKEIAE